MHRPSNRVWKWVARPRDEWKPTRGCAAAMYLVLYGGVIARICAGMETESVIAALIADGKSPGPAHLGWLSVEAIGAFLLLGISTTIVGIPEILLPERRTSRLRTIMEGLSDAAVGSFAIVVLTTLIKAVWEDPLRLAVLGVFVILPVFFLTLRTRSQRSIDEWRKPVRTAQRAVKAAKKAKKQLEKLREPLAQGDGETHVEQAIAATENAK